MPLTLATQNLDFALDNDDVLLGHVAALKPDIVCTQESRTSKGQTVDVPGILGKGWLAFNGGNMARNMTRVVLRPGLKPVGKGGISAGLSAAAVKMMPRHIVWVDVLVDGVVVRVISAHWPPLRYKALWPAYNRLVAGVIATRPKGALWVVAADFNQPVAQAAKALKGRAHGFGIVGYVTSPGLAATGLRRDTWGEDHKVTDHPGVLLTVTPVVKPTPTPSPVPTPAPPKENTVTTVQDVIKIAKAEVGYHEGRTGNTWNNHQKYSPAVPSLEWSQNQAWCATFMSWVAMKAKVSFTPRTASTDLAAAWFKKAGRWSEYPAVGAWGFLGRGNDMHHVFLVTGYDNDFVYTVEGNTNDNGSPQGDGVYALKRRRRGAGSPVGYGYPAYPEGIDSADPAWANKAPKPVTPARTSPTLTPAQQFRKSLLDACAVAASKVPASRTYVHALRKTVEAGAARIK